MKTFSFLLALMVSSLAFPAQAIQVSPLYSEYSPTTTSGILTVSNPSEAPKTYQVFVDRWTVENGEKIRVPSPDLRILPSVFTMEPGKRQTLRWALKSDGSPEQAYRIRLVEVPDPELLKTGGLIPAVNMNFPWFWRDRNLTPELSARWDGPTLVITNSGQASARLSELVAGSVNRAGLVGYVLPGETARFELNGKGNVPVSLKVNGKDVVLEVN